MNPPIYKTPMFWRGLAAEWRGPKSSNTIFGICVQLRGILNNRKVAVDAINFLHEFYPNQDVGYYFFHPDDRASRATLCDRIADTLEKEQQ